MSFFETFLAVLSATVIGQFCIFLVERYLKHRWDKAANRVENYVKPLFKRGDSEEIIMGKVKHCRIERTDNGKWIVDEKGAELNAFQKLGGSKQEVKSYVFESLKDFEKEF